MHILQRLIVNGQGDYTTEIGEFHCKQPRRQGLQYQPYHEGHSAQYFPNAGACRPNYQLVPPGPQQQAPIGNRPRLIEESWSNT